MTSVLFTNVRIFNGTGAQALGTSLQPSRRVRTGGAAG
jgi:hypothetical protein